MIATVGLIGLMIATAMAGILAVAPLIRPSFRTLTALKIQSSLLMFSIATAFFSLMYCYVISDFSVLNVAMNSHQAKPLLYKISGTWGNHEGSMLLWAFCISIFTVLFAWKGTLPKETHATTLSIQGFILVGFLLFILITSNPFIRLFPAPEQGMGLNPLLQDIGLAFHPPMLYMGYVGFSISFSAAIALLCHPKDNASQWARRLKPWILMSWGFLTLGIALGSWWAYRELGWGGFWFWDPVENASLMPWLAATALVHSIIILEKRDTLKRWTVLLAILTFSLSLLGTFLVRSGVLTSVHAFATDPARGIFILGLLFVVIGCALALFLWRSSHLRGTALFTSLSRESFLLINNLLILTACGTVLLGTLYPLLLEVVSAARISVGPPYFSTVFTIITVPTLMLAALTPVLNWQNERLKTITKQLIIPLICIVLSLGLLWWQELQTSLSTLLLLSLSAWLILSTLWLLIQKITLFRTSLTDSFCQLIHLPQRTLAMIIAHIGVGILAFSITATNQWSMETEQVIQTGDSFNIGPYTLTLANIDYIQEYNYVSRKARFLVTKKQAEITTLYPETRYYPVEKNQTPESAIYYTLFNNLYVAMGEVNDAGQIAVRSYYKPMINGLWIGALFMVIGIIFPLCYRRKTEY